MNGTTKSLALYVMTAMLSGLGLALAVLVFLLHFARVATYSLDISDFTAIVLSLAFSSLFAVELLLNRAKK